MFWIVQPTYFRFFFQNSEFEWDKNTQSSILASFFYGYIITQILGGWLADKFGGRRVWGVCVVISSIVTLLLPVCARTNVILVYVLRVLLGLATVSIYGSHSYTFAYPISSRSVLTLLTKCIRTILQYICRL